MILNSNERLDEVNESIRLIQRTDGLTFGTDALLLASYVNLNSGSGCELGGGTGIISFLLLSRKKLSSTACVEIQEEYASLIRRNAELNGLSDKIDVICSDVRDYSPGVTFDTVYSNPPYMKATSGKRNITDAKNVARHEIFGDIKDFCESAKKLTRFGGSFYAVYRPDRLTDLLYSMKSCQLEPKRITFVHANKDSQSSIVLVEARRGGGVGSLLTKPLFIYDDKENKTYSNDMKYILDNGSFPNEFYINNRG
ncbi:MAG: methyltransferase [Clostridia bacterium]|nr:methyltransferase [Clostridia bacterium]